MKIGRDDRGNMTLAMLVVVVGLTLSGTLGTLVISQIKSAGYDARRIMALHASQSGLEAGLAQIRASTKVNKDGETRGDKTKLQCDPMTGSVGQGNSGTWSVSVVYYDADPQGHWTDTTWLTAHRISCTTTDGPKDVPFFAVFTSVGTASYQGQIARRTLTGTYVFHLENTNILGGLVHVYRGSTALNDLCIDAGSGDPAPDTPARLQLCSAGSTAQTWAYTATLQFVLVSSQTKSLPYGMCLDAGSTHVANARVLLQPCQTTKPSIYRQQWSFNDSANLVGTNSTGTDVDGFCFNVETANQPGSYLIITKTCTSGYNNVTTFSADANVGAGQAASDVGRSIGQLINYNQFGRCLDDTGANPNATHMIAWPCKQNPNPNKVLWNQRYTLPAFPGDSDKSKDATELNYNTGTITMTFTAVTYCLQSPLSTAVYKYVTTKICDGSAAQQWTVYGRTKLYATSYIIKDVNGKCLQPRDPNASPADLYQAVNKISKIYVADCDGSTLQKWNADKNVIEALALKDINENPARTN
ncbi:ricin-type beta-trefoil lectin domain protein [Actinoplanes sp. LDG1-06]|uniref:Ricin-type beta-trefoil lectin domain protein n=1 Tax=Paractinoplanes ovalisporus TaxID=2810368 RepID=A0ABS2AIK3_9ACTN|nr:ricin-type beta-trefoil lectin domain protein [Actinoplanes ovalisporus]MBM2619623.1 ricin-type beta-trefoil lectin domain protein [Actinoplanes ovalisporus]